MYTKIVGLNNPLVQSCFWYHSSPALYYMHYLNPHIVFHTHSHGGGGRQLWIEKVISPVFLVQNSVWCMNTNTVWRLYRLHSRALKWTSWEMQNVPYVVKCYEGRVIHSSGLEQRMYKSRLIFFLIQLSIHPSFICSLDLKSFHKSQSNHCIERVLK